MASDDQIASFVGVTGASETAARRMLDMCGGDVEQSIMLWFADEELQRSLSAPETAAGGSTTTAAAGSSRQARRQAARETARNIGREDEQGVIHIDSEDEDVTMTEQEDWPSDDEDEVRDVARRAQEEEDAAVAQRLQEELYRGGGGQAADEEGVRAPMARTTETLVEPTYGGGYDDAHDAMLESMRRRNRAQARGQGPFGRSVWDTPTSTAASGPANLSSRLAEMFRPPHEIMSHFTIDEARDEGKAEQKWIMANLQDMSDFNCQALNRDIWKNEAIVELIKENFIFLQYDVTSPLSEQFINFYFTDRRHENPETFPYVAIIDPRTGGKEKEWSGIPFPSAADFLIALTDFLDRYSLDPKKKNPVSTEKRKPVIDVDRMTEEEMLELAMKNSMATNGAGSSSIPDLDDDLSSDKGKDKVLSLDSGSSEEVSAFKKIPSDRPHTEPANDPSSTTRLQVRNPPSRIIRRFRLDDPVARIYEWLKAEPLPGKEGIPFELKSVPQGADLIEHLDETIKEAGLANGTVMIEFITDDE